MERIDGLPLSSLLGASDPHLRHIAGRIVEGLIARPLLDPAPCAMFHADPHAGNLMVTDDGDLVAIDWSLVGRLSKEARVQTVQLLLGGWTVHRARMLGAIDALALTAGDPQRVGDVVDDALGCIRTGGFAGLAWLVRLLDELVVRAGVRFNRDLLMFRKALLTLTGVLADLDATFPIDAELFRVVTSQLAREWSERFWSDPFSRAFDLPLSNVDLMDACMAFPALAATTWMNTWRSTGHYS